MAITLEEAGLEYEPVKVDFAKAEQTRPEYLAINPKGRVPALALGDGDTILTETGALLDYIAAIGPGRRALTPNEPRGRGPHAGGDVLYLASTMHVAHAHKMRGSRWADQQSSWDDMTAKVPETMTACAAYVEAGMPCR